MSSPNQDLISYFKTNLTQGHSKEALTTAAKTIGWSDEAITDAWESITPEVKKDTPIISTPLIPEPTVAPTFVAQTYETPYRTSDSLVSTSTPTPTIAYKPTPSLSFTPDYVEPKRKSGGSLLAKIIGIFVLLVCIALVLLFLLPINSSSPLSTIQTTLIEKTKPVITFIQNKVGAKTDTPPQDIAPESTSLDTNQDYLAISQALENHVLRTERTASTIGTFTVEFPPETPSSTSTDLVPAPAPQKDVAEFLLKSIRTVAPTPTVWTTFLMKSPDATEADLAWYHTGDATLMKIGALSILNDVLTPENAPGANEWFRIDNALDDLKFIELFGFPTDLARLYLQRSTTDTVRPFMRTLMNDTSLSITKKVDPLTPELAMYTITVDVPLFTEHVIRLLEEEPAWDDTNEATLRLWLRQFKQLSFDLGINQTDQSLTTLTHRIGLTNATGVPIRIDAVTTFNNLDAVDVLLAPPTPSTRSIAGFIESLMGQSVTSTDQASSLPSTQL